jgi:hypothetical protein
MRLAARRASTATPIWVKAMVVLVCVGGPGWWLVDRHDRRTNEDRLAAIASAIAVRPVKVHCPGPIGREIGYDTVEGSVRFDADGNPADDTKLRKTSCAELDALAEGRRATQLACVERSTSCGDDSQRLAMAVDVITHEAYHLRGVMDEGVTECRSLQTMAWSAQRLGATREQAQGLARLQVETGYPLMPGQYHAAGCADGDPLDMRPGDPTWP